MESLRTRKGAATAATAATVDPQHHAHHPQSQQQHHAPAAAASAASTGAPSQAIHGNGGSSAYYSAPAAGSSSIPRVEFSATSSRPLSLTKREPRSSLPKGSLKDGRRSTARNTVWDRMGGGFNLGPGEGRVLLGLLLLGSVVRLYKIGRPSSVVFDEVHFGGQVTRGRPFANKYLQSRFFMDVHPPLAKLLIALMAYIGGFQGGSFDFKEIGREYGPDHVPYILMRLLPAVLGLFVIPIAYLTLRGLQTRPTTALLGALFITFENGLITQSRFILLDSPLIFFTALSTLFWVGFSNENEVPRDRSGRVGPFSRRWWIWLTLTGLALGAVLSCKWVGLFTIATIGVLTILQLWTLLGDLRVPIPLLVRHFVARALCLIAIPIVFYMVMFKIHFAILSNSGEGDGFMSSEFQHTLRGHGMEDTFADVMIGSTITVRHFRTQGGYLHSHPSNYPGGSKQQQITLYPHRDENNNWIVLNSTADPDRPDPQTDSPPRPLQDRDIIVLHHISTNKKLHSHDIRPPISEVDYQNEVSAYGFEGFEGDANDHFSIEIDQMETDTKHGGRNAKKRVQTLRTRFRLRHLLTGCYLFSHKVKLPEWGFEQQEVTCNKNPSHDNALWYIETNEHAALPSTSPRVNYRRPGFFSKFFELQKVMWLTNAGLTDRHAYDSRPHSWPLLRRGINFWVKDHRQIYLIGNPFVWYLATFSVLAYFGIRGLLILRWQRGYKDFAHSQVVFYDGVCGFLMLGWFLHFFPFFLMSRQLFLHHYFPALYFSILLSASVFDLATSFLKPKFRLQAVVLFALAAMATYWYFSPLTYAGVWTHEQCIRAQWRPHWDFSCDDFLSKDALKKQVPVDRDGADPSGTSTTAVVNELLPGRNAFGDDMIKAPVSSIIPGDPLATAVAAAGPDDPSTTIIPEDRPEAMVLPPAAQQETDLVPPPARAAVGENAAPADAVGPKDEAVEKLEAVKEMARNAEERFEEEQKAKQLKKMEAQEEEVREEREEAKKYLEIRERPVKPVAPKPKPKPAPVKAPAEKVIINADDDDDEEEEKEAEVDAYVRKLRAQRKYNDDEDEDDDDDEDFNIKNVGKPVLDEDLPELG
ncbi:BQ2448_1746 [Microbotryum intermedium]|uniref:dolichyl-phosphate-mannose--protein mannosyltransferase n=1 Tax=Microbotryum intermedium TaxID=269621 RepID=A0A238F8Z9_9BASI|nr:BQ2448_1746 [Microbotryum intermedium]